MDPYEPRLVPPGFGLNNTGAICYLNSLLQLLAGCTAVTRALLGGTHALTRTGAALTEFCRAFAGRLALQVANGEIALLSARVLAALTADLRERRPAERFGAGQQSASEALVLLLDMADPDCGPEKGERLADLFLHRYRCDLVCCRCRRVVSREADTGVHLELFHLDAAPWPATPEAFAAAIAGQLSETADFTCPACQARGSALRACRLSLAPDVLVCVLNLYVEHGGARRPRPFPHAFALPAADGGPPLRYRLVGQVEHAGGLGGGHYWARGLRAEGVLLLNDTGVTPSRFESTAGTYLVAYHYAGRAPEAAQKRA